MPNPIEPETHFFGGDHTEQRLDIIRKYLEAYTTAMRGKFDLWYIDAFAGTGARALFRSIRPTGPLLNDLGEELPIQQLVGRGSVQLALNAKHGFDRHVFIEQDAKRFSRLQTFCLQYQSRKQIELVCGDANLHVPKLCEEIFGRDRSGKRGVIFLDPYGMSVSYSTLTAIAGTQALDMWYLFPLSGLYRQAAHNPEKVDEGKRQKISQLLGTDDWEHALYQKEEKQIDLFAHVPQTRVNIEAITAYVKQRLERLFSKVEEPMLIKNERNAPIFLLFFAVSNRDQRATNLAMKLANQILKSGISSQTRPR